MSKLTTESALRKDKRTGVADLQHRHFATIAEILRTYHGHERGDIIDHFADNLPRTNPRFNRARFVRAATND